MKALVSCVVGSLLNIRIARKFAAAGFVAAFLAVVPTSSALAGTLTVTLVGAGQGSVVSAESAPLIQCSNLSGAEKTECSHSFAKAVTLQATAAPGSVFGGWQGSGRSGTCVSTNVKLECQTLSLLVGTAAITVTFEPPPPPPIASTGLVSEATFYSAVVHGDVNPEGHPLSACRFEFGLTAAYGHSVPCAQGAAEIGSGLGPVPVSARAGLLEPDTTYHFRLAASNLGGVSSGDDETLTTPAAPPDTCANAARREEQGSGALLMPECRAYELVSSADSYGVGVSAGNSGGLGPIASSGDRLVLIAQAYGDPSSAPTTENRYLLQRDATGWAVDPDVAPMPDHTAPANVTAIGGGEITWWPSGLGFALWGGATPSGLSRGEYQWEASALDGAREASSEVLAPLTSRAPLGTEGNNGIVYALLGGSAGLTRFVFEVQTSAHQGVTYLPGEPMLSSEVNTAVSHSDLYEIDTGRPYGERLSLVNQAGQNGPQIGGSCGAELGSSGFGNTGLTQGAISADGSVIYFGARPSAPEGVNGCSTASKEGSYPRRIFRRAGDGASVEIDSSECSPTCPGPEGSDTFQGASEDGSTAFFTSPRRLVQSDTDSTTDLYSYDASLPEGHRLFQVSAGEEVPGMHVTGAGAEVLGVLATAADGSRVYFVAKGVLAGNRNSDGTEAIAGKDNLYAFDSESGHMAFIGELAPADERFLWGGGGTRSAVALPLHAAGTTEAGDGRFLVFGSVSPLVPGDQNSVEDLYRYDAETEELACVSCGEGGGDDGKPVVGGLPEFNPRTFRSSPDRAQEVGVATEDASAMVFTTVRQLVPADTNQAADVYEWRTAASPSSCQQGGASIYSASARGCLILISGGTGEVGVREGAVPRISADGTNIFFTTMASLVSSDRGSNMDVYDARVGGGFAPATVPPPCTGEGCRPPVASGPATPAAVSGATSGATNPPVPRPTCAPGSKRRHGKCVKPKKCRKGKVKKHGKCVRASRHTRADHTRRRAKAHADGNGRAGK